MSKKSAMKTKERLDKLDSNLESYLELSYTHQAQIDAAKKIIYSLKESIEFYNDRVETLLESRMNDDKCWMDFIDKEFKKSFINGMLVGAWVIVLLLIVVSLLI